MSKFLLLCSCVICKQQTTTQSLNAHVVSCVKPENYCVECGKIAISKFCSRSCSAVYNNRFRPKSKPIYKICPTCSGSFTRKDNKYCSQVCASRQFRKYSSVEEARIARRSRVRETSAAYRVKVRNQTPMEADRKAIKEFYNNCPKGYEVDHVIPISKGGLHTLENLQYLTISENRRKGNKIAI